tara:strand:- start:19870 stop:20565 length:696 start_codon:yes stop_codon:yes gene_type:complete
MFEIPDNCRQEIKFVTNHSNYYQIISWIKTHSSNFSKSYEDRWINSIYFDSYDYESYASNLSGQSARTKLRYRWYGKKKFPSPGQLELKNKRNYFGWKNTFPVPNEPYNDGDNWRSVLKKIASQLPNEAAYILKTYNSPVIINRYKRNYFCSLDKKIRITVDRNQMVHDQRFHSFPNLEKKSNLPDTIVIEVKFSRHDSKIANKVMQGLPIRVSKHSKYINAVDSVSWNKA